MTDYSKEPSSDYKDNPQTIYLLYTPQTDDFSICIVAQALRPTTKEPIKKLDNVDQE